MKNKQITKNLAFAALMAALTFVLTFFCKIPVGINGGYVHLGDAAVMLAGAMLPWPYAVAAACIGAGLSDLVLAPLWIPATVLIKGLTVLCFTSKKETLLCKRNALAVLPAALLCAVGYYLYEAVLFGNWIVPLETAPMSFVQVAAGAVLYFAMAFSLDRLHFKSRVLGGKN